MIKIVGSDGKYLRLMDGINTLLTTVIDDLETTEQLEFVQLKYVNFMGSQNAADLFKEVLLHERLGVNLKYLQIQECWLSNNFIGDELVPYIKANPELTSLTLCFNRRDKKRFTDFRYYFLSDTRSNKHEFLRQ